MSFAAMMLAACLIDACIGWPDALYARIGHPVTWIGRLIAALERRWNGGRRGARLAMGALTTVVTVGLAAAFAWALQRLLPAGIAGAIAGGILAWPLLALRSMHDHAAAVARPLEAGDVQGARAAVSMIVGRDPAALDEAGIARAGLESLAENASDGIVAPLFWGVVAGLPGIAAYKAVNTLDSMIGHRNERHESFGKFAARLDDLANLVPARLTGLLFAAVSPRPFAALRRMVRDARHHRSPNAGWPEAALAASLGVRLSGPRIYGDRVLEEPWLNPDAPDPDAETLRQGLALYRRAMVALVALLALCALLWSYC